LTKSNAVKINSIKLNHFEASTFEDAIAPFAISSSGAEVFAKLGVEIFEQKRLP
jgi:hypothetical protein